MTQEAVNKFQPSFEWYVWILKGKQKWVSNNTWKKESHAKTVENLKSTFLNNVMIFAIVSFTSKAYIYFQKEVEYRIVCQKWAQNQIPFLNLLQQYVKFVCG